MPDEAQPRPEPPCRVCKMVGYHKLSCPEQKDGQLRIYANLPARKQPMPKLPEGDMEDDYGNEGFTSAQMHAFRAEGVREALERAAKLCETESLYMPSDVAPGASRCAAAIRSLAGKEGT